MDRDRLLFGVASVLAGTAVLMAVLGVTFNVVLLAVALPFGAAAYLLWADATGRLRMRARSRAGGTRARERHRAADGGRAGRGRMRGERERTRRRARASRPGGSDAPGTGGPSRERAREVLGVDADADAGDVRRAYRERVKDVHPDSEGGSEEAFKRVQDAYERLSEE